MPTAATASAWSTGATDAITRAPNQAGVSNIEAIALNPSFTVLYAADAYRLGTLNTTTGVYTNIGSFGFADDGTAAEIEILDVDALAFDQSGVLWGLMRAPGTTALIQINPANGSVVENAFSGGRDYIYITGGFTQIDDIGIDPDTGTMYGIHTNATNDQVVTINTTTGAATALPNLAGVADLEGMSFDTTGEMIATLG